ncbi:bifunctional polynucleotide phosphatase/kinase [Angomonas deanei]|nr:bifunctional polynucleotide phosphatase/kinase [Angomonas deanei]|eukprot:EPY40409.1 bifunctional polynucleotide phosphatase/kinase [Angomonas deanei]
MSQKSKRKDSPSRSRSPAKRRRSSSPGQTDTVRTSSEWTTLHDRAVLCLPPTKAMVAHSLLKDQSSKKLYIKVAAFDMDDTLIMPVSGATFSKDDPSDWKLVHPNVKAHLQTLHERQFLLVLFSNQSGIGGKTWNGKKADAVQEKIIRVGKELGVPLSAYLSTGNNEWRKPSPSMWGLLQTHLAEATTAPSGYTLDCNAYSFYVGDAAGRTIRTLAGRAKDFSCSDRAFAHNISIPFLTPEELFPMSLSSILTEKPAVGATLHAPESKTPFSWGEVSPESLQALPTSYDGLKVKCITGKGESTLTLSPPHHFVKPNSPQELVIFTGFPGCGKTTLCKRFFVPYNYSWINRDTLKTKEKCIKEAQLAWSAGRSIVIDNTNPSKEDRRQFIQIVKNSAQGKTARIRVIALTHSKEMAMHFNVFRGRLGISAPVPTIAYNLFKSKYEPLSTAQDVVKEGVTEVWEVPPVALLENARMKKFFYYL